MALNTIRNQNRDRDRNVRDNGAHCCKLERKMIGQAYNTYRNVVVEERFYLSFHSFKGVLVVYELISIDQSDRSD